LEAEETSGAQYLGAARDRGAAQQVLVDAFHPVGLGAEARVETVVVVMSAHGYLHVGVVHRQD
jgi:hypothetical protein